MLYKQTDRQTPTASTGFYCTNVGSTVLLTGKKRRNRAWRMRMQGRMGRHTGWWHGVWSAAVAGRCFVPSCVSQFILVYQQMAFGMSFLACCGCGLFFVPAWSAAVSAFVRGLNGCCACRLLPQQQELGCCILYSG